MFTQLDFSKSILSSTIADDIDLYSSSLPRQQERPDIQPVAHMSYAASLLDNEFKDLIISLINDNDAVFFGILFKQLSTAEGYGLKVWKVLLEQCDLITYHC